MQLVKYIGQALYTITGLRAFASYLDSKVTNYRLRLNIVPVTYKLFVWSIGLVTGASATFLATEYQETTTAWTFENPAIVAPVRAETAKPQETLEQVIERVSKEENFSYVALLKTIATCESGDGKGSLNTYAKNPTSSARGMFQILDMHGLTEDERYNPEIATRWTIKEIRKNGTKPWNASKHCWSK